MPNSLQPFVLFGSGVGPSLAPPLNTPAPTADLISQDPQQDPTDQSSSTNGSDSGTFRDALDKAKQPDSSSHSGVAASKAPPRTRSTKDGGLNNNPSDGQRGNATSQVSAAKSASVPAAEQPSRPARRSDSGHAKSTKPDPATQSGTPLAAAAKTSIATAKQLAGQKAESSPPTATPLAATPADPAADGQSPDGGDATITGDPLKAEATLDKRLANFKSLHSDADTNPSSSDSAESLASSLDHSDSDMAAAQDDPQTALLDPHGIGNTLAAARQTAKPQDSAPDSTNFAGAPGSAQEAGKSAAAKPADPSQAPEARFAEENHSRIVNDVHSQLLPGGGTMQLRLDPPHLGDLRVSVHMQNGVMTAAFETTNEEATKLLSHSLGQLRSMLEAQGVNVQKLHVQQAPKSKDDGDLNDSRDRSRREGTEEQRQSQQREQQRKAIIQKMWDKLSGKAPIDVVA